MANINLLPWREERRQEQLKQFIAFLCGAALVGAICVLIGHQFFQARIDHQEARNNYINEEILRLNKQIREVKALEEKKEKLLGRMEVIQGLQGNRPVVVHIMDEMVRRLPEGIYFTSVTRKGSMITIVGIADSNNRVASLMRLIDESEWLAQPTLKTIGASRGDSGGKEFRIIVKQGTGPKKATAADADEV